jgi:hypothetical protein
MCLCIHTNIHTCTYVHTTYIRVHTYIHTYIRVHTYIHTYYIHTSTYIHTYIREHTYIHTNIHTTYKHTCTYIHTYYILHTYIHTYILHDLRNSCVPDGPAQVEFAQVGTEYIYVQLHMYTRESSLNPNSNTLKPNRPQHDPPRLLCYHPAIFFRHLRFHSRKEEFGPPFKNVFNFFYF